MCFHPRFNLSENIFANDNSLFFNLHPDFLNAIQADQSEIDNITTERSDFDEDSDGDTLVDEDIFQLSQLSINENNIIFQNTNSFEPNIVTTIESSYDGNEEMNIIIEEPSSRLNSSFITSFLDRELLDQEQLSENLLAETNCISKKVLLTKQHTHFDSRTNVIHQCSNIETCSIFTVNGPVEIPNEFDNTSEYALTLIFCEPSNIEHSFVILEQFVFSIAVNWSLVSHNVVNNGGGHIRFEFILRNDFSNGPSYMMTNQAIELFYDDLEFKELFFERRLI